MSVQIAMAKKDRPSTQRRTKGARNSLTHPRARSVVGKGRRKDAAPDGQRPAEPQGQDEREELGAVADLGDANDAQGVVATRQCTSFWRPKLTLFPDATGIFTMFDYNSPNTG